MGWKEDLNREHGISEDHLKLTKKTSERYFSLLKDGGFIEVFDAIAKDKGGYFENIRSALYKKLFIFLDLPQKEFKSSKKFETRWDEDYGVYSICMGEDIVHYTYSHYYNSNGLPLLRLAIGRQIDNTIYGGGFEDTVLIADRGNFIPRGNDPRFAKTWRLNPISRRKYAGNQKKISENIQEIVSDFMADPYQIVLPDEHGFSEDWMRIAKAKGKRL